MCAIRLREDRSRGCVALLGSVPAETFELFRVECEDQLEEIERDALALERIRRPGTTSTLCFGEFTASKAMRVCLLGHVKGDTLSASHPLQLLLRVSHGLESLLDPFRGASAGPVPEATIQTALEACDAIRSLLASLTHNRASRTGLLGILRRLRVGEPTGPASAGQTPARQAAVAPNPGCSNPGLSHGRRTPHF